MSLNLIFQYVFMGFAAIVGLAVLIGVHEFGHFWVAKKLGFLVQKFSIGFGKPIWQRVGKDGTEYALSWIPVGGFVKLLDERNTGEDIPKDKAHMAFGARPVWARILVLLAGPGFNFIFAIIAFWFVFMSGIEGQRMVVDTPEPDTPAFVAGLQAEDEIVAINDEPISSWRKANIVLLEAVIKNPEVKFTVHDARGEARDVMIKAQGPVRELTKPQALMPGLGLTRYMPPFAALIEKVVPGSPADQAGLQAGDEIIAINNDVVPDWRAMVEVVSANPEQILSFRVKRAEQIKKLSITPAASEAPAGQPKVGRIGVYPVLPEDYGQAYQIKEAFGPWGALKEGVHKTYYYSELTLRLMGKMITGQVSTKNLSGPVTIVEYAGKSATYGWDTFLHFLAFLSLSLGVLNLLPIPVLDGGQVVYQLIEGIKGSPMSLRAQALGQQIGIALLLVLFSFAFYNDFVRLFEKF